MEMNHTPKTEMHQSIDTPMKFVCTINGYYNFYWVNANGRLEYMNGVFLRIGESFTFPEGFRAPCGVDLPHW